MKKVEFLYDSNCPNVAKARENLRRAIADSGHQSKWTEWERSNPDAPSYTKRYGSPTILIDGKDVGGETGDGSAPSCRIYRQDGGSTGGAPSVPEIIRVLKGDARTGGRFASMRSLGSFFGAATGVGAAFLPSIFCPACIPAYAGILSSLGIGFIDLTDYMLPILTVAMGFSLVSLAYKARSRHGYRPLVIGIVAAIAVVAGKIGIESAALTYGGVALLLTASVWNSWSPRRRTESCESCSAPE